MLIPRTPAIELADARNHDSNSAFATTTLINRSDLAPRARESRLEASCVGHSRSASSSSRILPSGIDLRAASST